MASNENIKCESLLKSKQKYQTLERLDNDPFSIFAGEG